MTTEERLIKLEQEVNALFHHLNKEAVWQRSSRTGVDEHPFMERAIVIDCDLRRR